MHLFTARIRLPPPLPLLSVLLLLALPLAAQRGDREGHEMKEVWRQMAVPEAKVHSPEEGLASLRVAPGFRVELVAAEPLVEDPVTIDWDEHGRMWVVEMRGFMPNVDGVGEQEPVGRVVVLEDRDGDGVMDESTVFLDGLVLARALAIVDGGVLVGEPPHLWYCRDTDGDLRCDEKTRVGDYGDPDPDALEHTENGLLLALDNWIYNAKSDRRFRFREGELREEKTFFRGQWGISQDDYGRLFYNTNSRWLLGDLFPSRYLVRNPGYQLAAGGKGIGERLVSDESVFTIRVNPGINRGYQDRMLRPDGRLALTTSVSGLAIYRGHQYPESMRGDVFIPEPAGNAVAHFRLEENGLELETEHLTYEDPDWGRREFLASTDERFRPVDCAVGPDGALYVVDMYRGILQHQRFVTTFLRKQILERRLDRPLGLGRIYRIVAEGRPYDPKPPALATTAQQIAALGHPNGWVRDTAQRLLVAAAGPDVAEPLRRKAADEQASELARIHALWTLEGRSELDAATLRSAFTSTSPRLREMALRASESLFAESGERGARVRTLVLDESLRALKSAESRLRLQAVFTLGELGQHEALREIALGGLLTVLRDDPENVYLRQAVISGLAGREAEVASALAAAAKDEHAVVLRELEEAASARSAGTEPAKDTQAAQDLGVSPEELERRMSRGRALYTACNSCHGREGQGDAGMGPRIAGAGWLTGDPGVLIRIVLDGIEGPLEIDGERWDDLMPGFRQDRRFDDEGVAALLTFLRRSWGAEASPVLPEQVRAVREEIGERERAWSVAELEALAAEQAPRPD